MALAPMVRIEAGGREETFTSYTVCSFSLEEGICHFRRPYQRDDSRLRDLMAGQTEATVTLYYDPEGKRPAMRASGDAKFFILSNTTSTPFEVIEDLMVQGTVELL